MAQNDWWANDAPVGQQRPAPGPVLGPPPPPKAPPAPKTSYKTLSPEEAAARGLPTPQPGQVWTISSEGKPTLEGTKNDSVKPPLSPEDQQAIKDEALSKLKLIKSLGDRSRNGWFATGFGANAAALIPGTTARDVQADTETVSAGGALKRIMEMSAQNGGKNPLTPLSNSDFQALSRSVSNLDPSQSDEQYQRNLKVYEDIYRRAYIASGGNPADIDAALKDEGDLTAAPGTTPPADGSSPPPAGGEQPFTYKPVPEAPLPVGDMSGMQQVAQGATRNVGAPEIENRVNQMWLQGRSMDEINGFLSANGYEQVLVAPNAAEAKYWRRKGEGPFQLNRQVPNEGRARAAAGPLGSYTAGAADAMTLGFSDELYGAANAAVGGDYTAARDRFQGNKQAMAELNPKSSLLGTVSGALLTGPVGRIAGLQVAPNATRAAGAGMAARPVATSAGMGALYGAGSDNENRLRGAVLGGAFGGLVGKGLQTVTPPIANALAERAAQRQASRGIPNAPEVAAAGQAEGVTVNRAMIDPRLENRVSGVDASLAGGPALRRGMGEIEGQIEGRVSALGRGGNVMDNATAGQTYQAAGERFIKESGKSARAKYDRAEKLAGDAKVAPEQSLQAVDDAIARLSETPGSNAAEIGFLNTLKSDLSKDLSVGGLRRMRTSLRKKISNGGLVFGEDEARVLGIMDAAAADIRLGLQAQGKGKAAKAFDLADKEYRGRMEFINGTLQKIIGKRNSNLSSEQVANNLNGMLRGRDSEGARAFLAKLDPEEHADFGATVAESLGRNNRGEFSVAHFLSQTAERKFPLASLKVAFGDEGAQSIQNLRLISKEVDRVNKMRNTSNTARAADYRSVVINTLLGLGSGFGSGSVTTGLATTAAAGGIKAGRDMLSARMLLNPKITRWVATAPRTTDPAAINAHIGRLESMSRAGTIGRMDAQAIQDYLRAAVGQSPGRAAAEDEGN